MDLITASLAGVTCALGGLLFAVERSKKRLDNENAAKVSEPVEANGVVNYRSVDLRAEFAEIQRILDVIAAEEEAHRPGRKPATATY